MKNKKDNNLWKLEKFGKCKKCGKKAKIRYWKGFYFCNSCFNKLTAHGTPLKQI